MICSHGQLLVGTSYSEQPPYSIIFDALGTSAYHPTLICLTLCFSSTLIGYQWDLVNLKPDPKSHWMPGHL